MVRSRMKGKRVLVVEDDRTFAEHLQAYLQMAGCQVVCAWSQAGCLEIFKNSDSPFDVALVDLYLPVDDTSMSDFGVGIKLAETLRRLAPKLKIIGLSHYYEESVGKAFSLHFAAFVQKGSLFIGVDDPSAKIIEVVENCIYARRRKRKPTIFIVHGHDVAAKESLRNYLQNVLQLGEPIVLQELPSRGRSVIEKFEAESKKADLVFVILTPDDRAFRASSDGDSARPRARQNVIFEMGYFFAKLQRTSGRVILLHRGEVELPSDIYGVDSIDISNGVEAAGEAIRREVAEWL
ncbi:MAG TPA: TIR domain-containing protein [Pyrinomonadaceae bacterium]|nr:TIR domain-containing protein [Pyrinomonadaceae bacterium]